MDDAKPQIRRGVPGVPGWQTLVDDPCWQLHTEDPRWQQFLKRIGFDPAQLAAVEFNPRLPI